MQTMKTAHFLQLIKPHPTHSFIVCHNNPDKSVSQNVFHFQLNLSFPQWHWQSDNVTWDSNVDYQNISTLTWARPDVWDDDLACAVTVSVTNVSICNMCAWCEKQLSLSLSAWPLQASTCYVDWTTGVLTHFCYFCHWVHSIHLHDLVKMSCGHMDRYISASHCFFCNDQQA